MSDYEKELAVFWFRRDLRWEDNRGLYNALSSGLPVIPLFIFDRHILDELHDRYDARVSFIHSEIAELGRVAEENDSGFLALHGKPVEVWTELVKKYPISKVYTNRDYEPYAKTRDSDVEELLIEKGIEFHAFKDHVITESGEVEKKDGAPYTVFAPYKKTWYEVVSGGVVEDEKLNESEFFKHYPSEDKMGNLAKGIVSRIPKLEDMGFQKSKLDIPPRTVNRGLIKNYSTKRDFPAEEGTSQLGIHFRFGTISIREKARLAHELSKTYLNELIWRDFYSQILEQFPYVADGPFRKKYSGIEWVNNEAHFDAWCEGKTGYPLVDAGMRELSETGFMHNRVRMVTASFLAKHLLVDWRWGEAWFARKLLDFDLASNNGGWQWAAGCGTDAAPYFRIFNPELQLKKFDKTLEYVSKFVPEYGTDAYPAPIVEHKEARERCLKVFKKALDQ